MTTRRMNKKWISCFMASLLVAGTFGCAGSVSAEEAGEGYKVAFVNFSLGNTYRVQMQQEFIQQAEAYKAEGIVSEYFVTNSDNDVAKQISDVQDMITKGVDAICITAASPSALVPAVEEAMDAGIVVIDFDNNLETDNITAHVKVDEEEFGRIGMQFLAEALDGKGKIVTLNHAAGMPTNDARHRGAESVLENYPDIEIIGEAYAESDYAKGKAAMESFLSAHPDIDGVWSQGGAMTQGAIDAFLAAGRDLVPMSGEGNNGFLRVWNENLDNGFTSIAPSFTTASSAIALQTAVSALNGEEVPAEVMIDLDVVTQDTLADYYNPELPDSYWVINSLNEESIEALYSE